MSKKKQFKRALLGDLSAFCREHPHVIQALVGPRQVGKTTLARQLMAKLPFPSIYASADAPIPPGPEWIESQWHQAGIKSAAQSRPVLLVLDEIQKVSGWSETLKRLWDSAQFGSKDIRLLILGSSALLLQSGLSESLSGRFYLHRCPHWSFPECRSAFGWTLDQWIYFGGYPGAAEFTDNIEHWKQYVADSLIETVLARDVLQLQRVAKPALLRHLFMLSAAYPAQILSYNKMLGQLQDAGNTTTLAHYLSLLGSAFLVSGLQAYSKGMVRSRSSSPKLILWNNALISALAPKSFKQIRGDPGAWGRLVENAVGAYLLNGLSQTAYSVYYWRRGGDEVDFVVQRGSVVWAVEVKSGRGYKVSGLSRFRSLYPESRSLIIGAEGIPLEAFFASSPQSMFDP